MIPNRVTQTLEIPELGQTSMIIQRPRGAKCAYIFGHGAGAPMTHPFMEKAAKALVDRKIAVLRYNYLYKETGKKAPDSKKKLEAVTQHVLKFANKRFRALPLFAGGKSMGGRITTQVSVSTTVGLRGLIFYGFPLHAPGKSAEKRRHVIEDAKLPMLFIQGERDKLADLAQLRPIVKPRRMTLKVIEQGNHSLAVPKRTGKTEDDVHEQVADWVDAWIEKRLT